jgi:hypothetical protein
VAQIEIGNIANNSASQVAVLNSNFTSMAAQVIREQNLQIAAGIDFANLVAINNPTVYSLIYNLPSYGSESERGGLAQFWEGVANIDTFTGQAVVATIREGKNLAVLGTAGAPTSTVVPVTADPPQPTANLLPSGYTASEAANIVIR